MNNSSLVEAYKSFYEQGKELYAHDDIEGARTAFLKAADLANQISMGATSYDVRMEYHTLAAKILKFVKANCSGKKPEPQKDKKVEQNDSDLKQFKSEKVAKEDKVTFADVAGLQEVKDQIIFNVIEPLKNPDLAKKYKIKPGAKVILYGPPGTGKTFIARAIAGEVDAEFFAVNCQDLISKYMGDSSKQLDALFEEAQKNERAIIFFDEFDSVASRREDTGGGVDAEMARFVATFFTKVDGFKKSKTCKMLLLMAATNRPWALDPAMMRGGRFDTLIYVGEPDFDARLFMVNKGLKDLPLAPDCDLKVVTEKLDGYSGGDITSICDKIKVEAYRRAVRTGQAQEITMADCDAIIKKSKKSSTPADLAKFEKFRNVTF